MADRPWLILLVALGVGALAGILAPRRRYQGDEVEGDEVEGAVVEAGELEGVAYQIRRTSDGYQGWVELEGEWAQLDEARGSTTAHVRKEIGDFVDWLRGDSNPSVNQLQARLADAGVRHFTARELLRIRHPSIAREIGYAGTFPASPSIQDRLVEVALIADDLRGRLGAPITVLNGYRPRGYNERVKGAPNSQHLYGRALDLVADDLDRLRDIAFAMYEEGKIRGLRLYGTNIHIDTRTGARHLGGSYAWRYA